MAGVSGASLNSSMNSLIQDLQNRPNPFEKQAVDRQLARQSEIFAQENIDPKQLAPGEKPYQGSSITYKPTTEVSPFAPKAGGGK
jgi:hypothetical protein